jgi:hypothetical protein
MKHLITPTLAFPPGLRPLLLTLALALAGPALAQVDPPTCNNGLTIELLAVDTNGDGVPDTCLTELWAIDLVLSPTAATYSINRLGETPDSTQASLMLSPADVGLSKVEIWVWDGLGGSASCTAEILVLAGSQCDLPDPLVVTARIKNFWDNPLPGVTVKLFSGDSLVQSVLTGEGGDYLFQGLPPGQSYRIRPEHTGQAGYLSGFSVFDMVLMSKHILGIEPLGSPYAMIAADLNNSGTITTLDLIRLRQLILSIDTSPDEIRWRFIPLSYVFPDPTNPWLEEFPEEVIIDSLTGTVAAADFIGIMLGDLRLGAVTSELMEPEERSLTGAYALQVEEQTLRAGEEYSVPFRAGGRSLEAYQGILSFAADKLEWVDVIAGAATQEHFGTGRSAEGRLAMSWLGQAAPGQELFSLVFRAKADGQLSEWLRLAELPLRPEAYREPEGLLKLALEFQPPRHAAGFELLQNTPNPFGEETVIGFHLPAAGPATLTITDALGKVRRVLRLEGQPGYNEIRLDCRELTGAGLLIYTLEAPGGRASRKMIGGR